MKILGYTYTVTAEPFLGDMGDVSTAAQSIRLDSRLPTQQMQSTLLHEIIEALNHALELGLTHPQIAGIEAGLFQVLNDSGVDLTPLLFGVTP